MSEPQIKSSVKFFEKKKGWGYINRTPESDALCAKLFPKAAIDDIWFHYSDIAGKGYRALEKEDVVTFSLSADARRGGVRVKAINVTKLTA